MVGDFLVDALKEEMEAVICGKVGLKIKTNFLFDISYPRYISAKLDLIMTNYKLIIKLGKVADMK